MMVECLKHSGEKSKTFLLPNIHINLYNPNHLIEVQMNRDIYKDEFGQYHEVEEETEESVDGLEDDDLDEYDDEGDLFDSTEEQNEFDEDEEYASEYHGEYDADDE